jgi:hypothetical protein
LPAGTANATFADALATGCELLLLLLPLLISNHAMAVLRNVVKHHGGPAWSTECSSSS